LNHLFVGLGGTGGKVLAALRRQIYQQYRKVEPDELAIDFLYIDTSAGDTKIANITAPIEAGDRVWRTLGHSVQLSPGQIVHLTQGEFSQILENLDDYPTIRPWIGERAVWQDIWNSAPNGIEAGGQLRRFGRLLFAQNARKVVTALQNRLTARQSDAGISDSSWTIHIVAGLAGGTGSGTFLDLVGQLRKLAVGKDARILLYAVLPETQDTSWAKENYYANGYAALAELNAMVVKRLKLTDVATGQGAYDAELPVNNCFIITNRNQNGLLVDMDKVLPDIIAETIFQTVIASGDARALGARDGGGLGTDQRVWRAMVTGENYFGGYEKDGNSGPEARANRFLTFGIKRIAIPFQEVREYATMVFLRQYLLRALNNNWVENVGFDDARRPFDAAAVVRNDDNRVAWCLTNAHLRLERPVLGNDRPDLRAVGDEFTAAVNAKTQAIIKEGGNSDSWARDLDAFARGFYELENGFRRLGVSEFYRVAERSIQDRARLIVRERVASQLFQDWISGQRSIRDTVRIVEELVVDVSERMAASDGKVAELGRLEEQKETSRKKLFADFTNSSKFNPLTNRGRMLQQLSQVYAELMACRAGRVAQDFMKKTMGQILAELQDLKADADTVANRLEAASAMVEARRAQRVRPDDKTTQSHQYKFYNPQQVRELLERLQRTERLQKTQTSELADRMTGLLGAQPSFARFAETMSEGRLVETLESDAESRAEQALGALESERERILEASIIQKLYEEYSGRGEELRRFVAERVNEAGSFAAFAPNQSLAQGSSALARCLVAFVPAADEVKDNLRGFHADLVAAIRQAGEKVEVIETRGRGHEIVFLSLVNQFPLRFLSALEFLRDKYEPLVNGPSALRKRLELHAEGDGRQLPALFQVGIEEVRKAAQPYWLIADCAGLLTEIRNATTGAEEVRLIRTNQDGEIVAKVVGDRLANGTRRLGIDDALGLRTAVEAHLAKLVHVDARLELKGQLIARKNAAMEKAGYDPSHPSVVAMEEPLKAAREILGV